MNIPTEDKLPEGRYPEDTGDGSQTSIMNDISNGTDATDEKRFSNSKITTDETTNSNSSGTDDFLVRYAQHPVRAKKSGNSSSDASPLIPITPSNQISHLSSAEITSVSIRDSAPTIINDSYTSNMSAHTDFSTGKGTQSTLQEDEDARLKKHRYSTFMGIYVGLMTALGGLIYGYSTGVINNFLEMPYVKSHFPKNGHSFTASESAILTSIIVIGTFFGALIAPLSSDRFGRRPTIIIFTAVVFNLGIVLQLLSTGIGLFCTGRLISGFGVGVLSAVIPLYQAEASPRWIRGSIICMYQWAVTWGLLIQSAISQGTKSIDSASCYRIPTGIELVLASSLSLGMSFLPESPRYYVRINKIDDAIMALSRLRRLPPEDESLIAELIDIKASYDYECSFGQTTFWDCFKNSPSRVGQKKRMLTGVLVQALQQCSGINFIFYYGVNFFVKTGVSNSYLMSLITYITNVVFTIPGILLIEIIGRRTLLMGGAIGMMISNFIIAIVGAKTDSITVNKVMLTFVCTFISFFASTWGPVCWVVVGEIYNLSVRQRAVALCAATNWFIDFIFAYCTPYMIDTGSHTASMGTKIFFVWGSLNMLAFFVAYFLVYETKGLMLEDIDELYHICKVASKSSNMGPLVHQMAQLRINEEQQRGESISTSKSRRDSHLSSLAGGETFDEVPIAFPRPVLNHSEGEELSVMHSGNRLAPVYGMNTDASRVGQVPGMMMSSILKHPNSLPPSLSSDGSDESVDFSVASGSSGNGRGHDLDHITPEEESANNQSLDFFAYGDNSARHASH